MAEMRFKLLEVDLTHGKSRVIDVTDDVRRFLGGRGLGAKLLWDRVPIGSDPLGPENILYFGVGPLTGFLGSVMNVSAKSPLTGLRGYSNMNGHFGTELIYAGYNAGLLLVGKAEKPIYLYIKDSQVEIRDASHLWGKLNIEAQQALRKETRKELDDQHFRIATTGPAGENLVRNASISHDFYHHAARLGMGAVMGSKKVKAIVVKGTSPPAYPDPLGLINIVVKFFQGARLHKAQTRRWGNTASMPQRYYQGTEGIKNKQLGWDPICDLSNPVRLEQQYKLWSDACTLCYVGCKVPYMRREPPLGPVVGEMRHDDAGGWNANVMIPGYDTQVYLTPFLDNLGLDNEDVSGVVAWAMECYEKGLLSRSDLDGIDLTWGNLEAICKLVTKIAYREGVGNVLAEGLKFAVAKTGKGSDRYAMHSKGVAITSYEPRGSMSDAVGLAVNSCGALHGDRGNPERAMFDSLATCFFLKMPLGGVFGSIADWGTDMLNAACGWELTTQDWVDIMRRLFFMERCYSLREGYIPQRDDVLPDRFFDEVIKTKYGKPLVLDNKQFHEQRAIWYEAAGLNRAGLPPKESLKRLGIDFVIPILEPILEHWE